MLCVLQQLAAELARQNDRPNLSFQGNLRPPALGGLHGDIPHLGHTDSGGTDGLQQKGQTLLPGYGPFPSNGHTPAGSIRGRSPGTSAAES